jgi:hypothetical protein
MLRRKQDKLPIQIKDVEKMPGITSDVVVEMMKVG